MKDRQPFRLVKNLLQLQLKVQLLQLLLEIQRVQNKLLYFAQ